MYSTLIKNLLQVTQLLLVIIVIIIIKYKDLAIEIQRMWNVKTKVIPVIIGATGAISKSFGKYVSNIPGNIRNYRKQPY